MIPRLRCSMLSTWWLSTKTMSSKRRHATAHAHGTGSGEIPTGAKFYWMLPPAPTLCVSEEGLRWERQDGSTCSLYRVSVPYRCVGTGIEPHYALNPKIHPSATRPPAPPKCRLLLPRAHPRNSHLPLPGRVNPKGPNIASYVLSK